MNITLGSNAELAAQREAALRRLAKQTGAIGRNGVPSLSEMLGRLADEVKHNPERVTALMNEIMNGDQSSRYGEQGMKPYTDMNIPELQRAALHLQPGRADAQGMTRERYLSHAGDIQRNLDWSASPLPPFIYEPPMRWRRDWEYDQEWHFTGEAAAADWAGSYMDDYEADDEAAAVRRLTNRRAERSDCREYVRYTNWGGRAVYRVAGDPTFYVFTPQDGGIGYYLVERAESYDQARARALAE